MTTQSTIIVRMHDADLARRLTSLPAKPADASGRIVLRIGDGGVLEEQPWPIFHDAWKRVR